MTRGVRCQLRKNGTRFESASGDWVTIGNDVDYKRVEVVFDSGTTGTLQYQHVKTGDFKDWMKPVVYGVGYVGRPRISRSGDKRVYQRWVAMLQRCYQGYNENYTLVTVADKWLNFSNFLDWCNQQPIERKDWQIDKDLLGGSYYSEDNCVLLPQRLNLLISRSLERELPTGVKLECGKYTARISVGSNLNQLIGKYNTPEEAGRAYSEQREMRVKELPMYYKNELDSKAFDALMVWKSGEVF